MSTQRRQCLIATGFIRDGKLYLAHRPEFDGAVQRWQNCKVVLRLEEHHNPRSVALNAFYWGVVIQYVMEATGYTDVEAHAEMKALHLPKRFAALRANGTIRGVKVFDGSTTDLDNQEEWEYIENIVRWAAETLEVVIPDPSEVVAAA